MAKHAWVLLASLIIGCAGGGDDSNDGAEPVMTTPAPTYQFDANEPVITEPEAVAAPEAEEENPSPEETASGEPAPAPPSLPEPEPEPANPDVHAGWSRAGLNCAAEGLACDSCDETTICFFGSESVCVPRADNDGLTCGAFGGCDPSRPYCIERVCMTETEANCYCTAQPGDQSEECEREPSSVILLR